MQGNNGNEWDDDRPQYQRSGRHLDDQKKKTWQRRKCVSLFKPSFSLAPVWVKERLRNLMAHLRQYFVAKNTRNSVENDHILFNLALGSLQTQSWTIYLVNAAPWIACNDRPNIRGPVVLECGGRRGVIPARVTSSEIADAVADQTLASDRLFHRPSCQRVRQKRSSPSVNYPRMPRVRSLF